MSPASRLRSEIRARPRSVHQMHNIAAVSAPAAPATSDTGDTCSVSDRVATAPTHHVRSPYIIVAPYATAPAAPRRLPHTASTNPSAKKSRRTPDVANPTALSRPTSRARCSTASRKNIAASSSADATRKKLK